MVKLRQLIRDRIVILDGATGTNLLGQDLAPGESPCVLNIRNRDRVFQLQRGYVKSGSDMILTNTFSANQHNFSRVMLTKVIRNGVALARRAAKGKIILGDIGPLGDLIKPYGVKDFETAVKDYKEIFQIFHSVRLRNFLFETFTSIIEAKAAFLAAQQYAAEIYVCFSFQESGRTIMGDTPEAVALTFEALGAHGVGVNCSTPDVVVEVLQRMGRVAHIPLIAKPNAGQVTIEDGIVRNSMSEAELVKYFKRFVRAGANMVGGCCGTSSEYIKEIAKRKTRPVLRKTEKAFYLSGGGRILKVGEEKTLIVGERLNPSGRKHLRACLKRKEYAIYGTEAKAQEDAGSDALDVNAFVDVLDEADTLKNAVCEVIRNCSLPLFIDTQDYKAAESVLRLYPGIGVYNSVPARREALVKWLPMIRRYGFMTVVSLIGKRIPKNSKERMRNVELTLNVAKKLKFPTDDLIFDPLVFPVATERKQIASTLETLSRLRHMGLKTILGISNISYGLPNRSLLNAALTTAAVKNHATFLILNPLDEQVIGAVCSSRLLFQGMEPTEFIQMFRAAQSPKESAGDLMSAIMHGNVEVGTRRAKELLNDGVGVSELTEQHLAKALEMVGEYYEQGTFFIPDLIKAAEVAQSILNVAKPHMPRGAKHGKVVVATVKGDIHDIGKNIAAMIFESAGYEVVDLGKDVSATAIVKAVRKFKPEYVGLSALLTTTMTEMGNVVRALKQAGLHTKVIIGGPNVSDGYAQKIGAFGAARNAFEGLRLVQIRNRAT